MKQKTKLIPFILLAVILMILLIPSCASETPEQTQTVTATATVTSTPTATQHPETLIYHLDLPMGIGQTEMFLGRDDLLRKTHPWLRISTQETQGTIFNTKVMVDEPQRYENTIYNADFVSVYYMLPNKKEPFTDGFKDFKPRALHGSFYWTWLFLTDDPDINTLEDLEGKRIACGAKAGTMNWTVEEIFRDAGMHDKVKWQHMTFADIAQALLGGTADAGFCGFYYNPADKIFILHPPTIELLSSGRDFHLIDYGEETKYTVERLGANRQVILEPNTMPEGIQPMEYGCLGMCGWIGSDATLPDEIAYEYTKWSIEHCSEFSQYSELGKLFTPALLSYGLPENVFHPGALRAYQEAGLDQWMDVARPDLPENM